MKASLATAKSRVPAHDDDDDEDEMPALEGDDDAVTSTPRGAGQMPSFPGMPGMGGAGGMPDLAGLMSK